MLGRAKACCLGPEERLLCRRDGKYIICQYSKGFFVAIEISSNFENDNGGKHAVVKSTCLLLVRHFRNLIESDSNNSGYGFNTRIFSHILHPEKEFVFAGCSEQVTDETPIHPEHVVPCATLILECKRLIRAGMHTDEQIAFLLQKHWRLAFITKKEQRILDFELGYKSTMPEGWSFESGDTFERFHLANISIKRG